MDAFQKANIQDLQRTFNAQSAELDRLRVQNSELLAALERTSYALELAFSQKPLRDMAETLAEARAAIAKCAGN